jgi:tRNA A-37 threonylcarbamoyl transferase component Bud32
VRFVFSPPTEEAAGLLTLPWTQPLEGWRDPRLVEIRQRGISRHIVRFVADSGELYALKAINENLARREYRLLRKLAELGVPAVHVVGVVVDRGPDTDAILVTRFLDYSTTYRAVFSTQRGGPPTDRLLDALVELLVRLHLAGFFWGDCSLSNTLFRLDAGALQAIFVDAETSELHPSLTDGQRGFDVELASERVGGELLDLAAAGLLPPDVEPVELAEEIPRRYQQLWDALTEDVIIRPEEQRYRMTERLRRLNDLGFDADEVELVSAGEGFRLRIRTRVAEPGHHRHRLRMLTGLDVQENQARRLLNDIASYRGYLEEKEGKKVTSTVAASRWLRDVYDKALRLMPPELADRLSPAEVFHQVLEHRWFLSELAGRDVGTTVAARSYFDEVLPTVPEQLVSVGTVELAPRFGEDTGSWLLDDDRPVPKGPR